MGADDIAQIMNEIEELQQEMNASVSQKPKLAAVPPVSETESPDSSAAPAQTQASSGEENAPAEDDSILKEFTAGAPADGEPSLEASMAELKDDTVSTGRSLLDDPVEEEKSSSELSPDLSEEEKSVEAEVEQLMHASQSKEEEFDAGESSELIDSDVSTLTMSVQGNMAVRFEYQDRKESLLIKFNSDSLQIILANGAEFKIPNFRKT